MSGEGANGEFKGLVNRRLVSDDVTSSGREELQHFPARKRKSFSGDNDATWKFAPGECSKDGTEEGGVGGGELNSSPSFDSSMADEATSKWDKTTTRKKKNTDKKYRRYEKPPYSYVGLIALAIQSSSNKMLKLSEILNRISSMFPFFKGEYQGWRDSVRHNLSQNKCFKKVLPDPSRPQSKGNYWTVDVNLIPAEKLKRQNTSVSRNVAPGYAYARDLTDIFDLNTGMLKVSPAVGSQHGFDDNAVESPSPRVAAAAETSDSNRISETSSGGSPRAAETRVWTEDAARALACSMSTSPKARSAASPYFGTSNIGIFPKESELLEHPDYLCCRDMEDACMDTSNEPSATLESSGLSSEDTNPTSGESTVPTDSSDDCATSSNRKTTSVCGQKRRCRRESRMESRKRFLDRNEDSSDVISQAKKSPVSSAHANMRNAIPPSDASHCTSAPPNQKPFGDPHAPNPRLVLGINPSVLWSSIDQTVGPEGPPNITWASANPLNDVLPFFRIEPSRKTGGDCLHNDWTQDVDLFSGAEQRLQERNPQAPASQAPPAQTSSGFLYEDQSDFIAQQASILPGRANLPNHHLISPLPAAVSHYPTYNNIVSFPHPALHAERLGLPYYSGRTPSVHPQPMHLPILPHTAFPSPRTHFEFGKGYSEPDQSALPAAYPPRYAWPTNRNQVNTWPCGSAFLPVNR